MLVVINLVMTYDLIIIGMFKIYNIILIFCKKVFVFAYKKSYRIGIPLQQKMAHRKADNFVAKNYNPQNMP